MVITRCLRLDPLCGDARVFILVAVSQAVCDPIDFDCICAFQRAVIAVCQVLD